MAHEESVLSDGIVCVREAGDAARVDAAATSSGSRRHYRWGLVLGFVLCPAPVFALIITLSFESVAGFLPLAGDGTNTAMLDFGRVSAFGPLNAGVSRTLGASSYTISTTFGVRARRQQGQSSNYTLQARLQTGSVLTWRVDGLTMSTSPATIATLQQYNRSVSHTLAFVVPFSQPAGAITTVFEVTAIAN
jgi:hypothetical protein